jgi:2-oxoglutarate ferredoxin oxidoreductase subunit gamma
MVANVVALGAIAELTGIVDPATLTRAVLRRAPTGTEDKNRKAVEIGVREARKLKEKS